MRGEALSLNECLALDQVVKVFITGGLSPLLLNRLFHYVSQLSSVKEGASVF